MVIDSAQLLKLIQENSYLGEEDIRKAVLNCKEKGILLYQSLIDLDLVSDQNLGKLMAEYLKKPFIDLSRTAINRDVVLIIPKEVATANCIIAFEDDPNALKVATSRPENTTLISNISKKVGKDIHVYFATERDISNCLSIYKDELQTSFDRLLRERFGGGKALSIAELPVKEAVNLLIEYAYSEKASDIHIEPKNNEVLVRFRVDGVLHDVMRGPKILHEQMITRIKVLARLPTDAHLSALDGKIQIVLPEEAMDVRVSIIPIIKGEKAVLRLLSSKSRQFGLSDLGMSDKDLEKVKQAFKKPYGMILSTGPTGSGKTTSMYSILKILNTRDRNISTIEDPVEYEIEGINQIQVNDKTNLTFATGLRSILRQDPNIIFVGEIRDIETANIGINAAMTGHLVLSTLHTNDAATTLPRLMDLKVEPFLVASTINIIVAQRLARKICEKCRVSSTMTKEEMSANFAPNLVEKLTQDKNELRVYKGKGCKVCRNTGYVGRVGVFEVLIMSPAIQDLIAQRADSSIIAKQAIKEGMTTMFEDGISKVLEGLTTVEELLRAVKE
ncbi:MAG: GspE/PulE family protein [Candidatus Roizmanbacteria bacterium]